MELRKEFDLAAELLDSHIEETYHVASELYGIFQISKHRLEPEGGRNEHSGERVGRASTGDAAQQFE
jgi:hypothetical protein